MELLIAFWVAVNGTCAILTALALIDAWRLRGIGGAARRIVARGNVRRVALALAVQVALLSLAVPGYTVWKLIAAAVLLLVSTVLDAIDRRSLRHLTLEEVLAERDTTLARIEQKVEEVGRQATAAYHEANSVNQKIDARTHAIERGEK